MPIGDGLLLPRDQGVFGRDESALVSRNDAWRVMVGGARGRGRTGAKKAASAAPQGNMAER